MPISRYVLIAALMAGLATTAAAEDAAPGTQQIRNAPSPRGLELAAYIYAASNVCGYKIGVSEFDAILSKLNMNSADVGPRGRFGTHIQGMFTMMSNDMALHREQSCIAVAGEYGPEGKIAKNVLQPMVAGETAPAKPQEPAPAK